MRSFFVLLFHAVFIINISHIFCVKTTFTAAVYEHKFIIASNTSVVLPEQEALRIMMANIDIYEFQIKKAKEKGVGIIVFPEYGINGFGYTRDAFRPFLEDIPDPQKVKWNGCEKPDEKPVLHRLSCLAKQNTIYLVVNMGDVKICNTSEDHNCPSDGRYQYNTDIAFDKDGYLVARYHKQHPFLNEMKTVDRPVVTEYITFDSDFGRFGLFTCFDVLFYEPAVKLVETMNVDHVAFPTAWFDVLPLFSAIGFHGSWARGMQVNFLAANSHVPLLNNTGSGIYSAEGDSSYYRSFSNHGALIIATLRSKPNKENSVVLSPMNDITNQTEPFYSELFGDLFLFQQLVKNEGSLKVCYNDTTTCCFLSYKMAEKRADELYAVGVFDGLHTLEGQYYLRVCTLIKCSTLDKKSCGESVSKADTIFESFSLRSELRTPYVFPQLVSDGVTLSPKEWRYNIPVSQLQTKQRLSKGLITAALFGRVYKKDNQTINTSPVSHIPKNFLWLTAILLTVFNI